MKPRTKLHHQVLSLSECLPNITIEQKKWAFSNCLKHIAYRTKSNVSCLDCGHIWVGPQEGKGCTCPSCNEKLEIVDTRKKKFEQTKKIMAVLDVKDGFQVVRFFEIFSYHKSGEKPNQYIWEVVQQYFAPDGKLTIVGRNRTLNAHVDSFNGDLEIRNHFPNYWTNNKYDIWADRIFPKTKLLPIYKRNGFSARIKDIPVYRMLKDLEGDTLLETLLKANQMELAVARLGDRSSAISRYWSSIKICIRNRFVIRDPGIWLDYIDLLNYFGRDLNSPKYICPKNLKREHDLLVRKKTARLRQAEAKRKRLKAIEDQQAYMDARRAFFGLVFKKEKLQINILETVSQFIEEADVHKHCVFTNEYYKKPDSLIFSAKVDGVPVETIEVSLSKMKVVQSRGRNNKASEHNDSILELMNKSMPKIRKRYKEFLSRKEDAA